MIKSYSARYSIPFVGRTKEIADITARLVNPACRLLTVTGLGGSGKTRLAIEAAIKVAAHFPHGTALAGLQPLSRSDLLVPAIAQSVGLSFYGEGALENQLLDYLQEKTLLLLLDNFEHVLDGAALVT
jgi:predicted ATPase